MGWSIQDRRGVWFLIFETGEEREIEGWWKWGGGHEKYKNKCESPKVATTEGTTTCYTEADARTRSCGRFVSFLFFYFNRFLRSVLTLCKWFVKNASYESDKTNRLIVRQHRAQELGHFASTHVNFLPSARIDVHVWEWFDQLERVYLSLLLYSLWRIPFLPRSY